MQTCWQTVVKTEGLSFTWNVEEFTALWQLALLNELPSKDRLSSREFGNAKAGLWRVELLPYGSKKDGKQVSLFLCSDKKHKPVAEYSMVVLNEDDSEMPGTLKVAEPRSFTGETSDCGWDDFLSVENESDLKPYLVDGDCLRLKITVKVYCRVSEDEEPRGLLQIVNRRCRNNDDDSSDDDDDDDSALAADNNDNQSTVSPCKLPPSGGATDTSASSSPSLPSGVETTNDENIPCCSVPGGTKQTDFSKFAVDPRTYDMTIICQGRKFRCNRYVLGVKSKVFKAMLCGKFDASKQSEIEINDIPSDCVEDFLTFLATDTCSSLKVSFRCRCEASKRSDSAAPDTPTKANIPTKSEVSSSADSIETENAISTTRVCSGNESCRYVRGKDALYLIPRLFNLLAAADTYQVLELSSKCSDALTRCIYYRTVVDVLDGAEALKCSPLIDACWHYVKNCNKVDKIVTEFHRFRRKLVLAK